MDRHDGTGAVDIDLYILDTGVSNADNNDPNDDLALVESIDFRDGLDDAKDYDSHGTHIAGIAAAVDDNDGLVGLAPGARIHNYKVLGDNGQGDVSQVIAAVEHILAEKLASPSTPMVVNLSLGENIGSSTYTALDEALVAATQAGIVVVAAAGNHDKDASGITPAHVDEVITVGSFDMSGQFSGFSNWGAKVDILAPGQGIVDIKVEQKPDCPSGTCLRIKAEDANKGVRRAVDLSGALSATLTFDSRRHELQTNNVHLEVSSDGGASWTRLKTYAPGDDNSPQHESFDLSPYISANTQIRFFVSTNGDEKLRIDNVQIVF